MRVGLAWSWTQSFRRAPSRFSRRKSAKNHRMRRKEEWRALERFDTMLDSNNDGEATTQEALALLLSEGYAVEYVKQLMETLDADGDGVVDGRNGVRASPLCLPHN